MNFKAFKIIYDCLLYTLWVKNCWVKHNLIGTTVFSVYVFTYCNAQKVQNSSHNTHTHTHTLSSTVQTRSALIQLETVSLKDILTFRNWKHGRVKGETILERTQH